MTIWCMFSVDNPFIHPCFEAACSTRELADAYIKRVRSDFMGDLKIVEITVDKETE